MDALRLKLEKLGYSNISYMVVNSRDEQARQLHSLLDKRLSEQIVLYAQDLEQPDVWTTMKAEKDDFLIYDRCGRLTFHISLPYSILSQPHVEEAIKKTYCDRICGDCSTEGTERPAECSNTAEVKPEEAQTPVVTREDDQGQSHGHGHHHGHHHHHGRHHGQDHDPSEGLGHGHHGDRHRGHHGHEGHQHHHGQHQHEQPPHVIVIGQGQQGLSQGQVPQDFAPIVRQP